MALVLLAACHSRLCRDPHVWTPYEYGAVELSTPPAIDGDLSDAAWRKVPWTRDFFDSMSFELPRQRTRAKLAWDRQNLYLAFEVEDDDIQTPYVRDDEPLYNSEVAEIFLDADDNRRTYDEIEISPANKLFDASFVARRVGMDLSWSSGTQHAVKVDGTLNDPRDVDQGWTAELAIPFARLTAVPHVPPRVGDRWRFDLFRLDHERTGVYGMAVEPVMVGDFHNLSRYGMLRFLGPAGR